MKHALSFDIEDWFHIVDIPELEDRRRWNSFDSIVEEKTELILDILHEHDTKATFFILGWIAKKYPDLSKQIAERGHEIATHSFWHRRVYKMDREDFKHDLSLSIELLEKQTGENIRGFRAPSFSIKPGTEWAFDIMYDLGLVYDASLFPASRGHGGYPCLQQIHTIPLTDSYSFLFEIPMSIQEFGPVKMPFSGGGYLRLLPEMIIHKYIKNFEDNDIPAVVYLHPRDFAPDQPRVKMPLDRKFKSYVGLGSTEGKLRNLLETFEFDTCYNVLVNEVERRSELEGRDLELEMVN